MRARPRFPVLIAALAGLMMLSVAGCNKPQEATGTAPTGATAGTEIDDSMLATRVKSALLADPEVKSFDFEIEAGKGHVLLSGLVDSRAQVDRAIAVARGVVGVKGIESKVSLKGAAAAGNQGR